MRRGYTEPVSPVIVDVAVEPHHVEVFRNSRVRAYVATLAPGTETLFHRHSRDTLYVVLAGGRSGTRELEGGGSRSYIFPKSLPLTTVVWWGVQKALVGSYRLPDEAFFLQIADGASVTHAVKVSKHNRAAMKLLGVEIIRQNGAAQRSIRVHRGDHLVFSDPEFEVFRFQDESRQNAPSPCLLVPFTGPVRWVDSGEEYSLRGFSGLAVRPL